MRLPRVRFSVRGLMVAVAIVAIALGTAQAHRRARRCAALAATHDRAARFYREESARWAEFHKHEFHKQILDALLFPERKPDRDPRFLSAALRVLEEHHGRLARRYASAAARPWEAEPGAVAEPDWDAMMWAGDPSGYDHPVWKPEPDPPVPE